MGKRRSKRQAALVTQKKHKKEEEEERLALQKARELDEFDQQNHRAVPQYTDQNNYSKDKNGFHGANSVKATSLEEEALRTMKAFWLPSATPEAPVKVEAPWTSAVCPECNEKLELKSLFPVYLTEDRSEMKKSNSVD